MSQILYAIVIDRNGRRNSPPAINGSKASDGHFLFEGCTLDIGYCKNSNFPIFNYLKSRVIKPQKAAHGIN